MNLRTVQIFACMHGMMASVGPATINNNEFTMDDLAEVVALCESIIQDGMVASDPLADLCEDTSNNFEIEMPPIVGTVCDYDFLKSAFSEWQNACTAEVSGDHKMEFFNSAGHQPEENVHQPDDQVTATTVQCERSDLPVGVNVVRKYKRSRYYYAASIQVNNESIMGPMRPSSQKALADRIELVKLKDAGCSAAAVRAKVCQMHRLISEEVKTRIDEMRKLDQPKTKRGLPHGVYQLTVRGRTRYKSSIHIDGQRINGPSRDTLNEAMVDRMQLASFKADGLSYKDVKQKSDDMRDIIINERMMRRNSLPMYVYNGRKENTFFALIRIDGQRVSGPIRLSVEEAASDRDVLKDYKDAGLSFEVARERVHELKSFKE